jgi:Fe-S-cluster containining protein
MDYFAEERLKSAEEVVNYLPDTIYAAATFEGVLTKAQLKELRLSVRQMRIAKGRHPHKAFKKLMKLGMNTLRKALAHVRGRGLPLCEGDPGCSSCCRRLVVITSKLEATAIEHWLRTADKTILRGLRGGLRRMEPKKKSVFLAMGVSKDRIPDEALHSIGHNYAECGGLCPALGPTGRCLIYPVRPWSCRTYRGLTPKPCTPGNRVNLVRFPDIDMWMWDLLEAHAGKTKTTLFPVIREALKKHPQNPLHLIK